MIPKEQFKIVIDKTPLVSIDLIVKCKEEVLLGKRINKPAKGYYFTTGGRIFKNEVIQDAMKRIALDELGMELSKQPEFIGVFEHFYQDSIFDDVSTHYVNLGYILELDSKPKTLPKEQHSEYKWFGIEELLQSNDVSKYVKDYFKIGVKN